MSAEAVSVFGGDLGKSWAKDSLSRSVSAVQNWLQHLQLFVTDPYDVALTKLKRDRDKDFQDMLQLAEKIPFDLDVFEKRYREELRDNTTGTPEANDVTFSRRKEAILEDRARKK